jgi:hypothetical protein
MEAKTTVVGVREARVRTLRMQSLRKAVYETKAVVGPLVQIAWKKTLRGKLGSARLAASYWFRLGVNPDANIIKEGIEKRTDLAVRGGPMPLGVRVERLIQMVGSDWKIMLRQEAVQLVLNSGKLNIVW